MTVRRMESHVAGARVLDVWMDGRHVQLRQPVVTDWASTAAGRGAVTGRVVTPMPGQVTKVSLGARLQTPSYNQPSDPDHTTRTQSCCVGVLRASTLRWQPRSCGAHGICWLCCAQVFAQDGDKVAEGDAILELSSMKLFYAVNAPCGGVLSGLRVKPGDQIGSSQVLCDVISETDSAQPASAA